MKCNARPYNGEKPYVFFSYCHEDETIVYPIIEQMAKDGYRVWYDEGIQPGSDWPEMIANKLSDCDLCICALSEASSQSHNCKNEMTFALENKKTLLVVILEDFVMPLGVKLQLANTQNIRKREYPGRALFEKIYMNSGIYNCLGEKQDIEVHGEDTLQEEELKSQRQEEEKKKAQEKLKKQLEVERLKRLAAEAEAELQEADAEDENPKPPIKDPSPSVVPKEDSKKKATTASEHSAEIEDEPKPIVDADKEDRDEKCTVLEMYEEEGEKGHTILEASAEPPELLHLQSGKRYEGLYPMTSVGRSKSKCDIVLSDYGTISSHHLDLIIYKKKNYVLDRGSSNGTKVNGESLEEDKRVEITDFAELSIASELFLVAFGNCAKFIRDHGTVGVLLSKATHEKKYLFGQEIILGRAYKWPGGAMSSDKISRDHAIITYEDGLYHLVDTSTNGTYINRKKITKGEPVLLKDNDEIRIGGEYFLFNMWYDGETEHEDEE